MNGGWSYVIAVLGPLWFTVTLCQDVPGNCTLSELYCPMMASCTKVWSNECDTIECRQKERKYPCEGDLVCYKYKDRCDGIRDCLYGTDEMFCDSYKPPRPFKNLLKCQPPGSCTTARLTTASSVTGTTPRTTTTTTTAPNCHPSQHVCDVDLGRPRCFWPQERCDGATFCLDGSDEINCVFTSPCGSESRCRDGDGCYLTTKRCDDYKDCLDGSDEDDCPTNNNPVVIPIVVTIVIAIIAVLIFWAAYRRHLARRKRRHRGESDGRHSAVNSTGRRSGPTSSYGNNNGQSLSQSQLTSDILLHGVDPAHPETVTSDSAEPLNDMHQMPTSPPSKETTDPPPSYDSLF